MIALLHWLGQGSLIPWKDQTHQEKIHYIKDAIIEKDMVLKHISTSNMVADPLTKPIARDIFVRHVRSLELCRM